MDMRKHIKQFLQTHKVKDFSKNFQRYRYMNIVIFTNISQKYPKNKYLKFIPLIVMAVTVF